MPAERRERYSDELPRFLLFATAMTCGLLIAMGAYNVAGGSGFDVSSIPGLGPSGSRQKSAPAWWLVAGSTLVGTFMTAVLLKYAFLLPRVLRWILVGAFTVGLAIAGRMAVPPEDVSAGAHVLLCLAVLGLGAVLALFGTYFALRS
jgi:hypothetical protein